MGSHSETRRKLQIPVMVSGEKGPDDLLTLEKQSATRDCLYKSGGSCLLSETHRFTDLY